MKITKKNLTTYLRGSQFLATGGGLPMAVHKKIFDQILKVTKEIISTDAKGFSQNDQLISAYGVGDPSQIPDGFDEMVMGAFCKYTKLTKKNIKGLIPGEIGAEGLAFHISLLTGIPVIDADLVGGRAAPEIQLDLFSVFDLPITPVLLIAMNGKSILLEGKFSAQEIERTSRSFFVHNGSSGLLIGYGIDAKHFVQNAIVGSISMALQIGTLLEKNDMAVLARLYGASVLSDGMVREVVLASKGGFFCGEIILSDGTMKVKNENIKFIKEVDGHVYTAPDIMMFIDKNNNPIHNTHMHEYVGKKIRLIHMPAMGYWKTQKAKKLWQ